MNFYQIKFCYYRDNDSKRCKRQRRYMRREHMTRNPIESGIIPVSIEMQCISDIPSFLKTNFKFINSFHLLFIFIDHFGNFFLNFLFSNFSFSCKSLLSEMVYMSTPPPPSQIILEEWCQLCRRKTCIYYTCSSPLLCFITGRNLLLKVPKKEAPFIGENIINVAAFDLMFHSFRSLWQRLTFGWEYK